MLQEAVDALIDNGRRGRPITGPGSRPLKSLSHMLKGKQDASVRTCSVNVLTSQDVPLPPLVQLLRCTNVVPREMAIELLKPFVMREIVATRHRAKRQQLKRGGTR